VVLGLGEFWEPSASVYRALQGCGQLQTVVLVNTLYLHVSAGLGGFIISEPRLMSSSAPSN